MITLTVTPDDGPPYEVTATSRDVLMWEKTTKGNKSFVDLLDTPNLIDLYRVAHIASWRQGLTAAKNLAEFESTCEVTGKPADDDEDDDAQDPTQSGASPDSSSGSPSEPASPRPRGQRKASART